MLNSIMAFLADMARQGVTVREIRLPAKDFHALHDEALRANTSLGLRYAGQDFVIHGPMGTVRIVGTLERLSSEEVDGATAQLQEWTSK